MKYIACENPIAFQDGRPCGRVLVCFNTHDPRFTRSGAFDIKCATCGKVTSVRLEIKNLPVVDKGRRE